MASSIFVMSNEQCKGVELVADSIVSAIRTKGKKAILFHPIASAIGNDCATTVEQALCMLSSGKKKHLQELILQKYYEIAKDCDVVVCVGTDYSVAPASFESRINFVAASSIDAPLALVLDASSKIPPPIQCKSAISLANEMDLDIVAFCICNGTCCQHNDSNCCSTVPVFEVKQNACPFDEQFIASIIARKGKRVNPIMFEHKLIEQAKKHKMRIVLPEGTESRILRAAHELVQRDVVDIILLGDENEVKAKIAELGLNLGNVVIINPEKSEKYDAYSNAYAEYRKAKGVTLEQARQKMLDGSYFGTMMIKQGDADGMVSGSINTTAHTIRPAFEFIKTKPGFSSVSGVFLMCMPDRVLVFADCAVTPNPTTDQLAETAVASAETAKVFGIDPKVAFLSYGTGNSGKGPSVDATIEAVSKAKAKAPNLPIEGPIQYDAAIVPEVAKTKLPNSPVAGNATVFIFPDLNAGNICYKAVQRAANAIAIGPILQGLNKPVNDLSRGCLVPDIINTVAITAIQAQAEKGLL